MNTELIDIDPKTAAVVKENARRLGITVNDYLRLLLPPETEMALGGDEQEDTFEDDMHEFGSGSAQRSYGGTYDRADIYFDHN
jgi:hypothetical protein